MNESYCTSIDLFNRNLGLALSICQQGPRDTTNLRAVEKICHSFSTIAQEMSSTYLRLHEFYGNSLQKIEKPQDEDAMLETAITKAMGKEDEHDGDGMPFRRDAEDDDVSIDSSESSVDLDSMLPSQRENYLKTKAMEQAVRHFSVDNLSSEAQAQNQILGNVSLDKI